MGGRMKGGADEKGCRVKRRASFDKLRMKRRSMRWKGGAEYDFAAGFVGDVGSRFGGDG